MQYLPCRYVWNLTLYVAPSEGSTHICGMILLKCILLSYVLLSFFFSIPTTTFIGDVK